MNPEEAEHRKVFFPKQKTSLDEIYGEWRGGWILLPTGKTGAEIMAQSKVTKAELDECKKRGAT